MLNIIDPKLQFRYALSFTNNPVVILIHHALHYKCTVQDVHSWHLSNGWEGFGYHYFISRDGKAYKGRPENAVGAHEPAVNKNSIGICLEGCYQDYVVNGVIFTQKIVPQVQLDTLELLTKDIQSRRSIPVTQVKRHSDYSHKLCPGNYFPWFDFINKLGGNAMSSFPEPIGFLMLGSKGEQVKWLQSNLNKLGFDCGIVDGDFGAKTDKAVKLFQTRYSLVVDGIAGAQTIKKIKELLKPVETPKAEPKPVETPKAEPKPVEVPKQEVKPVDPPKEEAGLEATPEKEKEIMGTDIYKVFIETNETISASTIGELKAIALKTYPGKNLRLQNSRTGDIVSITVAPPEAPMTLEQRVEALEAEVLILKSK